MVAFLFSIGHKVGSDTPLKLCDFHVFWFLCNAHVSWNLPRVAFCKPDLNMKSLCDSNDIMNLYNCY